MRSVVTVSGWWSEICASHRKCIDCQLRRRCATPDYLIRVHTSGSAPKTKETADYKGGYANGYNDGYWAGLLDGYKVAPKSTLELTLSGGEGDGNDG